MEESGVIAWADQCLRNMGLEPTTVPTVLIDGRIPSKQEHFGLGEVEKLLLEHRLVTHCHTDSRTLLPGGWKQIQVTNKGYDLITRGSSIGDMLRQEAAAKNKVAAARARREQERVAAVEDDDIPRWFRRRGEIMDLQYDRRYEQPTWWAKYRLRRRYELFPRHHRFPETWWEIMANTFFQYTSPWIWWIMITLLTYDVILTYTFFSPVELATGWQWALAFVPLAAYLLFQRIRRPD